MVTDLSNERESHMLHHDICCFFAASNFYDFFNQYRSNMLKNPTVRGLKPFCIKHNYAN